MWESIILNRRKIFMKKIILIRLLASTCFSFTYAKKDKRLSKQKAIQTAVTGDSVEIKANGSRIVMYADGNIKIYSSNSLNGLTLDAGTQPLTLKGVAVK